MIDVRQIKAARSLLEWKQSDLAQKSGLSLAALANIERGAATPRKDTLELLQLTFEKYGVEFLHPAGVQLVAERFDLKIWDSRESQFKLWADIAREFGDGTGGILHISSVSDRPLVERYPKETKGYVQRMNELQVERRILLCEGDEDIIGHNPDFYRHMPKILFNQTPYYIYGDKVAFLFWDMGRIIRIENKNMAAGFKAQFDYNWSISQPLKRFNRIL